jgi:hypothetical protein
LAAQEKNYGMAANICDGEKLRLSALLQLRSKQLRRICIHRYV